MKRHRIDVVALIIGLAFVMFGVGFVVNETTGKEFNAGAAAALGLVTLGIVALLITLLRPKRFSEPGVPAMGDDSEATAWERSAESTRSYSEGDKE